MARVQGIPLSEILREESIPQSQGIPLSEVLRPEEEKGIPLSQVLSQEEQPTESIDLTNIAKGAATAVARIPSVAGGLIKQPGEIAQTAPPFDPRAMSAAPGADMLSTAKKLALKGTGVDEKLVALGQSLIDTNRQAMAKRPDIFQAGEGRINSLLFDLGAGATSLAGALGLGLLTKNPGSAVTVFGLMQRGYVYEEARQAGVEPEKAGQFANISAVIEGALEGLGVEYVLKRYGPRLMTWVIRAATEATQEWSQQTGENIVASNWRDYQTFWDIFQNSGRAAFLGAVLGGGASVAIDSLEKSGAIRELEQIGIPRKEAKQLLTAVAEKQQEVLKPQLEKVVQQEIQETEISQEPPVTQPGLPQAQPKTPPPAAPSPIIEGQVTEQIVPPPTPEVVPEPEPMQPPPIEPPAQTVAALAPAPAPGTRTIVKARLKKLTDDLRSVEKQMALIEKRRSDLIKTGKSPRGLDAQLQSLSRRFNFLDSSIAQIMTSIPEDMRQELVSQEGTLKLEELEKAEKRGARTARTQTLLEQKKIQGEQKAALLQTFREKGQDIDRIKQEIRTYAENQLPRVERGKIVAQLSKAKTENQLQKTLRFIDKTVATYRRRSVIEDIKKTAKNVLKAKNIASDVQARIGRLVDEVDLVKRREKTIYKMEETKKYLDRMEAAGQDVEMPKRVLDLLDILNRKPIKDVPTRHLESILEQVDELIEIGELKFRVQKSIYELKKDRLAQALAEGSVPLERHPLMQRQPGTALSFSDQFKNAFRGLLNAAQHVDLAVTPMDVIFDLLDGVKGYSGPNSTYIKQRLDTAFSRYLDRKDGWVVPIQQMASRLGLNDLSMEKIGIYAYLQQVNGRTYLKNQNLTDEQIDAIRLTPNEKKMYDKMREVLEEPYDEMQRLLRKLYNHEMTKVLNYFPVQIDFNVMDDLEIVDLTGDSKFQRLSKHVEMGFTEQRKGTRKPVKLNAMEVFTRHMDDVAYFLTMAEDIRMITEVVSSPQYAQAAGQLGQNLVREWLDTMARKGGAEGAKKIAILDSLRRNFGSATLGFKLSSILIQPTAYMDGAARIGGTYVFRGMSNVATSRRWRQFMRDNFAELRDRGADDPAYLDLSDKPKLAKWQARGFWALQQADIMTASGVTAGAYLRALDRLGIQPDLDNPNQQAITEAQRELRRSQASAFFKDSPLMLSRGALTGNRSIDRMLGQFQSFILTRWSQIRHDAWRAGIKNKSFVQSARILAYLTAASAVEAGIRTVSNKAILVAILAAMASGDWDDVEWEMENQFEDFDENVAKELCGNVPWMGRSLAGAYYDGQVVPAADFASNVLSGLSRMVASDEPEGKVRAAMRFAEGVGQATGIPFTSQGFQLAREGMKR